MNNSVRERNITILKYHGLVVKIARKMIVRLPPGILLGDLIGYGMVGLIEAANRFNSDLTGHSVRYIALRVKGAMVDFLRKSHPVSRTVHRRAKRVRGVEERTLTKEGRKPTSGELREALGVTNDATLTRIVRDARTACITMVDLLECCDSLAGIHARNPEECLLTTERTRRIDEAIQRLPDRERTVVVLSFIEGMSLREIGRVLGLTESRIYQVRKKALKRLASLLGDVR